MITAAQVQSQLGSAGTAAILSCKGYAAAALSVTGTFSGTISFEGTVDGVAWFAMNATPAGSTTPVSSTTSTGMWALPVAGLSRVRARMSSYASGGATVTIQAIPAGQSTGIYNGGGGAMTISDGADVAEGSTTDAKVVGDNSGTVSAKLRGLNYLLALVTDTVNNWLKVSIQDAVTIGELPTNTPYFNSALSTTVQTLSGAATVLDVFSLGNPNAVTCYVQLFNTTGSVTLGSTAPTNSLSIPAGATSNLVGAGLSYSTGVKLAATTDVAGNSAPTTGLVVNIGHRS